MLTSSKNKNQQLGLTLTELLVTLAILSLMTGISGIWLRGSLPGLVVKTNLTTLEQDLKEARLHARTTSNPVSVTISETGYAIETLQVNREFARGITVTWETATPLVFNFNGTARDGGSITLKKGDRYGTITIDPLTGKISSS